jgi:hypothetical protein
LDPWWESSSAVQEFNQQQRNLIKASNWKVEDESMSAWCPRKTKMGGPPNISYIIRKPEPLGIFLSFSFWFNFLKIAFNVSFHYYFIFCRHGI